MEIKEDAKSIYHAKYSSRLRISRLFSCNYCIISVAMEGPQESTVTRTAESTSLLKRKVETSDKQRRNTYFVHDDDSFNAGNACTSFMCAIRNHLS